MPALLKLVLFILALAIGAALTLRYDAKTQRITVRPIGIMATALLLILVFVFEASVGQVGASDRGVILRFGASTGRIVPPGLYFVTPFVEQVEIMSTQTHTFTAPATAASGDLQQADTKIAVTYKLDPLRVNDVYVNLGRDFVIRVIEPFTQEAVKSTTAQYTAENLIHQRPLVRDAIEKSLKERLGPYGILVQTVSITDFQFSPEFKSAIESKAVAAQSVETAKNKLLQITVEADQAKARAEGAKNAAIAQAQGEAQAILTVANAQGEANRLVGASLTKDIITYAYVQRLAEGTRVIVVPNGQQFFLPPDLLALPTPVATAAPPK